MENLKSENVRQISIEYVDTAGNHRHISATEWGNGEGVDVTISDDNIMQISFDDYDAMAIVVTALRAGLPV